MAEEVKQQENKCGCSKGLGTCFKMILGLVFLGLGLLAVLRWWTLILLIAKACVGPFLILAGIITLAIAKD